MQYPPTPSSSATRVPTTPVPNAPYMSPKDLPPSPVTPTRALPGHGAPVGALQMYPLGYGAAPGAPATHGLMTPPTTPERARGPRGSAGYAVHPMLRPQCLYFNIALPYAAVAVRNGYTLHNAGESFTMPPASAVQIDILGVFRIEVRARPAGAGAVTVRDVLEGVLQAMAQPASRQESQCFSPGVQQSVATSRTPRRFKYLGPRVLFSAIEVTRAAAGVVHCDLQLANVAQ